MTDEEDVEQGEDFEQNYAEREYERLTGTPMSGKVVRGWIA